MNRVIAVVVFFVLTVPAFADTVTQSSYSQVNSNYPNIQPAMKPLKMGNGSNEQARAESAPPQDYTNTRYAGQDTARIARVQAVVDAEYQAAYERNHPKPAPLPVQQTINNVNVNVAQPDGVHVGSTVTDR